MSESALVAEWRRCLQACYELIQEGVALFGSVADQRTCSEVAGSHQGADYVESEYLPSPLCCLLSQFSLPDPTFSSSNFGSIHWWK